MRIFSAAFCLIFLFVSCKKDKDHNAPKPTVDRQAAIGHIVDSVAEELIAKWDIHENTGGIFIRVSGPKGSYLASNNISPEVHDDMHFRVASISKTFTAAAIMLLHQQGQLDIDDPMLTYLPQEYPYTAVPNAEDITVKQLLQHRAGVFDVTNQDIPSEVSAPYAGQNYIDYIRYELGLNDHTFSFDEMVRVVADYQLVNHLPDETFHYSNTGYNILGKIVEFVSGESFTYFLTHNFIHALDLSHTYSVALGDDMEMTGSYLPSYLYLNGEPPVNTSTDNMSAHISEGQIVSTPRDISRWMRSLLTGEAGISPENVELMKEMQPADEQHGVYGLGLTFTPGAGFGHDGAHLSYLSTLRYDPDSDVTVLAVSNFFVFDFTNPEDQSFYDLAYALRDAAVLSAATYREF